MKPKAIIGMLGKAGSGKDFYAEKFKTEDDEILKITKEVILMVQSVLKVNLEDKDNYEKFKESNITSDLMGRDIIRNMAETIKKKFKKIFGYLLF